MVKKFLHIMVMAGAIAVMAAAGCGEKPNNVVATPEATSTPTATPTNTNTPTPTLSPTPVVVEITIHATGDTTLGTNQHHTYANSFHEYYETKGNEYFLKNVKDLFSSDDFTIFNLEGSLTHETQIMDKEEWVHAKTWYYHIGYPKYIDVLTVASVEAVSLANNHIMDFGQKGIDETIKTLDDAGIVSAMSNPWGDYYGLYETEKGIKIGFVSVHQHYDHDNVYPWLESGYKWLKENGAAIVIACTHWGENKVYEADSEQEELGHWCIDYGFDLVVGCHAHYLQGIEEYKGKYIVYSMGNFCYGGNKNPDDKDSMIWEQTFTLVDGVLQPQSVAKFVPVRLSSVTARNDYCPVILEGDEAAALIDRENKRCKKYGLKINYDGSIVSPGYPEAQ